jgi:Ribonuclease E/G family
VVFSLAEWLFEAGIGENRAALVDGDVIIEAHIEADGSGLNPGATVLAKITEVLVAGKRIVARDIASGEEILINNPPPKLDPTQPFAIAITRAASHDGRVSKRATGRVAEPGTLPLSAPSLEERITESGIPIRSLEPYEPDLLAQAGWDDVIEQAENGELAFAGGTLLITPTPALTLIDVDGWLAPLPLAMAAAEAAGKAIRLLGIGGSIAIDFPTVAERKARTAMAEAVIAHIPPPVDHAGVNQFGLMHIVRPRARASLIEMIRQDAAGHAARQLIRRTQRSGPIGNAQLTAHPKVITALEAQPGWLAALGRQLGGTISLRAEANLAMGGGYASSS